MAHSNQMQKATMLFKIITNQIDINADNLLIPNPNIYHTRGYNKRFMIPMTRIDAYKFSFFQSAINSLSRHVINSSEIEQFKHSLANFMCLHQCFFYAPHSLRFVQYNINNNNK